MPPRSVETVVPEKSPQYYIGKTAAEIGTDPNYKHELFIPAVIFMTVLHITGLIGFYYFLFEVKWITFIYTFIIGYTATEAVTIGTHRFFTHRSFKATPGCRLAFILLNLTAGQNSILKWARDHRIHHKYSDTDADPHNATRGFFFSHMGWLMVKKHPAFKAKCKTVDLSDLEADPLVMFQYKYYFPLYIIVSLIIPVFIPYYFLGETFFISLFVCYFYRYMITLHGTWTVNSLAHLYGYKPYDKTIMPKENTFVAFISLGEGWHNYHHAFPWDYKAGEYGLTYNFSATIIETLAALGFAYDLKAASDDMVNKRKERTGDGTDYSYYYKTKK